MLAAVVGAATLAAGVLVATPSAFAAPASPSAGDACPWVTSTAPDADRARQVVAQMTVDEKIAMVHGLSDSTYAGSTAAVPRLCIPELRLADGPSGVHLPSSYGGDTTQLPSETALAASFDTDLAYDYGSVIGSETKAKGADIALSPTINIVRDPRWGRAFESMGEDPYSIGKLATADVKGVQDQDVMAQVKHWALYNQETNRGQPSDNVIVDDRTIHEIYTAAFGTVVDEADPSSVMCSYSWINGVNACESSYLNDILKGEHGFGGFITSDWWGTKSTVAAANAGMDMEMPDAAHFGDSLVDALTAGTVPLSRVDDMVARILAQEFRFGLIQNPVPRTPEVDASTPANRATARAVSEAGTVLLKNENDVLPLSSAVHSVAVIGDGAGANTLSVGGGSAWAQGSGTVTPFDGIRTRGAQDDVDVKFAQGYSSYSAGQLPAVGTEALTPLSGTGNGLTAEYFTNTTLSGAPAVTTTSSYIGYDWRGNPPVGGIPGANWSARYSGTVTAPTSGTYTFSVTSDDGSRLKLGGATVIDNWADQGATTKKYQVELTAGQQLPVVVEYYNGGGGSLLQLGWQTPGGSTDPGDEAVALASSSDVAVVYANLLTAEGEDLATIDLPAAQNALISRVAAANPNTIVVLNTGSAVAMPWLGDVAGVLEAWYPGQESGNAIAALLFGDVSPSGKLPVSFPKSVADLPASTPAQFPGTNGRVEYSEGLDVGYRWYDSKNITPEFAFGYGLTYSSFEFSNLVVHAPELSEDGTVEVSAHVKNVGARSASDVAQLYLSYPTSAGEPTKALKGFSKVQLAAGESTTVSFTISAKDASYWSTAAQQWVLAPGAYKVRVGDSSRAADLPLSGSFQVTHTTAPRYVEVAVPGSVRAGETAQVVTTFHNDGMDATRHVINSVDLPDGWTARATSPATANVPGGGSLATTWDVTVAGSATGGPATIAATAVFTGGSRTASADVAVEFASVDATFDTVAVTDDADQSRGDLDETGASFSLQALAAQGVTPGNAVPHLDGVSFPTAAAGTPNAVRMNGQTIAVPGAGAALSLLLTAYGSNQTIEVTLHYTDGTSSVAQVAINDWWNGAPASGSVMVARATYQNNRVAGKDHDNGVSLYGTSVPLDQSRTLRSITLPVGAKSVLFAVGGVKPRSAPSLALGASSVVAGSSLAVHGAGFGKGEPVKIVLQPGGLVLGSGTTSGTGTFHTSVSVPRTVSAKQYTVQALGQRSTVRASHALTVTPPAPVASSISLALSSSAVRAGSTLSATVRVTAPGARAPISGTVRILEHGKSIASAKVSASGLVKVTLPARTKVGTSSLTAVYSGSAVIRSSTSRAVTLKVTKASSTTSAKADKKKVEQGSTVKLTVRVTVPPALSASGTVHVYDGTHRILSAKVTASGRVTLKVKLLKAGTHHLVVRYQGTPTVGASSSKHLSVTAVRR